MDPLITTGLKVSLPALREGFRLIGRELARRPRDDRTRFGTLDNIFDEAIGVLAREADGLLGSATVAVKGLVSRPNIFRYAAPARWIATEIAQNNVRSAALAAVRGEDDSNFAQAAITHYGSFFDDELDIPQPDGEDVYIAALEFLLLSLERELKPGERAILARIESLGEQIEQTLPPDTSDLVDRRVAELAIHLRQARFFRSAENLEEADRLSQAVMNGRLRGASATVKASALALCARIAAFTSEEKARTWLEAAHALAVEPNEEMVVARAFVKAIADWEGALGLLNPMQSRAQATAMFQILRNALGDRDALDRAEEVALDQAMLDSDGRLVRIAALVATGRWGEALADVQALESIDYDNTPALMWSAATVLVSSCLPQALRPVVLHDIPASPQTCPLREDEAALEAQRTARALMETLAERCDALNLPREANAARRYALWLGLVDPNDHGAIDVLRERFASGDGLPYLPLALGFRLDVDFNNTVNALRRRFALESPPTPETMNALAALLVDQAIRAPVDAEVLLNSFRPALEEYIEPASLLALEVRILVDAGKSNDARRKLDATTTELGAGERAMLESLINERGTMPDLVALESHFRENQQPATLVPLLERLREDGFSERYLEVARMLLEEMPTTEFAVGIVDFLVSEGRDEEAAEMLDLVSDLLERSEELLAQAAWLRYRLGELHEAENLLARLEGRRDDWQDRELRLQMIITTGRWDALDGYLDRQWERPREPPVARTSAL